MTRTDKDIQRIADAIEEYVQQNGVTTTRMIAEYVKATIGLAPSLSTVAKVLRQLGYDTEGVSRWSK